MIILLASIDFGFLVGFIPAPAAMKVIKAMSTEK